MWRACSYPLGHSGMWTPLPADCEDHSGVMPPPPSSRLSGPLMCGYFLHDHQDYLGYGHLIQTVRVLCSVDCSASRLSLPPRAMTLSTVCQSRSLSSSSVSLLQCGHPQGCVPYATFCHFPIIATPKKPVEIQRNLGLSP